MVPLNGRIIEVTNYYEMASFHHERTEKPTLNDTKFFASMKHDILKNVFVTDNLLKADKRIFTYPRLSRDYGTVQKLFPLLNSGVGLLYQVRSDIKALLYLLEHYKTLPWKTMTDEIDNFRLRLSHIYEFDFDEMKWDKLFTKLSDLADTAAGRQEMHKGLEDACDEFGDMIHQ